VTTVLVTGVGAIIGYGILRALRAARPDIVLIAADIYPDAVGQAWADHFQPAPLTSSPDYAGWLEQTIARHNVDLVIPGIEQDNHFLSDHRDDFAGVRLALNDQQLVDIGKDKLALHDALMAHDDQARIDSLTAGTYEALKDKLGLPFILKPRRSYASKGIVRVTEPADFEPHADRLGSVLVAQPLVGDDSEEYTVGAFGNGSGLVLARIAMRRRLSAQGSTEKAWIVEDASLDAVVARLFSLFKPIGPTNLQFRKTSSGWKLLEINPRISSSTSLRTAFGYNEAEMCVAYYVEGAAISQPVIRQGSAMRYIEDWVSYDRTDL